MKWLKRFKKAILVILVSCMTVGLITAREKVYASTPSVDTDTTPEATILNEDIDSREESTKTFVMSDKSKQTIVYSVPVHYYEDGEWKEIDNSLVDEEAKQVNTQHEDIISDNENNSSAAQETSSESDEVIGYQTKNGSHKIKFTKKIHKNNLGSITYDKYKVTWGLVNATNKSQGIYTENNVSDDLIESVLSKINQEIKYSQVFDGIDLRYDIDSLSVKENIVINKEQNLYTFEFNYKTKNLELSLNDEGEIEAKDGNKVIFKMPKPFMYDNNEQYSDNVHYELNQKGNKKYVIKIVADQQWMNDESRVYPITIDPVIQTETTKSAIDTTFVTSNKPTTNHYDKLELLVGKEASEYGNCRTLVKFALPALNRGDMVIDAELNMASYNHGFYASSTPDLQINAHMATSSWAIDQVTWNTCPSYESMVLDYDYIKRADKVNVANWKKFDITNAVKRWYDGTANNGILLKSYNENGTYAATGVKGYIWPERYNSTTKSYPYISLTYRNNKGIEDYWDFSSISTTSAGDISINNYSGNPVVNHQDTSTSGNKLPVTISHVYNGYMANKNMPILKPYVGKGWKLNIQQMVRPSSEYGLTGTSATNYPYVYTDEDGTEHYFKKVDSQYLDEDGLNLELKKTTNGYTITDSSDTIMTFNASGYITKITDSNDNSITYTYSNNIITKVTDGNNQTVSLDYTSDGYLSKITDPAGKVITYTYTNGLLTTVTYPDGKTSTYAYDGDYSLNKLTSTDGTVYQLYYTSLSSGKRVNKIVEKGDGDRLGQTVKWNYNNYNITEITTSGIDYQIGTNDDMITILEFDNAGRIHSRYAYTNERDIGVECTQYTSSETNASSSDIKKLNRITRYTTLTKPAINLLTNHSGESTTGWSHSQSVGTATFSFSSTNEEKLFGQKSFKINTTACSPYGRARFYQDINTTYIEPNTTYTASAYVKTKNIEKVSGASGAGASLIVYINAPSMPTSSDPEAADYISEYILGTTDEDINNGWRRISVTFTTPSDVNYIRINGVIRGAIGTAYFDGLQLEKGEVYQPYNMIENCSFERTTSSFPNSWTGKNLTSSDIVVGGYYMDDTHSMKVTSSVGKEKEVSQTIAISGNEEDTYVIGGWSNGKGSKARTDDRKYEIAVQVNYSDGSSVWKTPAEFNDSVKAWKYVAMSFDLSDGTDEVKIPVSLKVCLRTYGQANTVYFDSIQLVKKSVTTNIYDNNGNVISSNDDTFTYTDGKLTSDTDADGNTTTYTYDENGNLTEMTYESGINNEIVYDEYGNIVEESITGPDDGQKSKTESVYDSTHSYKVKDIDEDGKETSYNYNINKGLLNSVTDARGNTTSYTYNNQDQLTNITSGSISNTFTYDTKGRTTGISHTGASYEFTYDAFNNKIKTLIGGNTVVTDTYANGNGDLIKRTLGNGHYIEYQYDELGNLVALKENGQVIEKDIYDSLGNMIHSYDYKTNV